MIGIMEGWIWEQGNIYLNEGSHFRVGKSLDFRGVSRGPERCPVLGLWAAEEREPEMARSYNHTTEYLTYHHRTFIWRWMEIETETHIGAMD